MKIHKSIRNLYLILSLIMVGVPAGAYAFNWLRAASAGYKAYKAYKISDADVVEYVKQTVNYMDRTNKVLPSNNPYSQRLARLTKGLKSVDGVPLNFKVYQIKDEVNAFACADGSVRVYTSIMDLMTDDELLGVIGHEIGHVGGRHSRKAIKTELLTGALRDALASYDNNLGMLADSQLGALGELMLNAKYSRKQETEADDYGYNFLKKSGKNPWSMIMGFEKLKSLEGKSSKISKYVNKMFSSHPDTQKRIDHLKARCKKDGFKRPSSK